MIMPWCTLPLSLFLKKTKASRSHLQYTIPPAVALTSCYHPLSTSLGVYKILFLIVVGGIRLWGASMRLPSLDCRRVHHSVGFVPHPHPNMDVSSQRNHWSYSFQNTSRRGFLLCHSDLQYIPTLPHPQQAHIPPSLPPRTEAAQ